MSQEKKLKALVVDDEKVVRDFFVRFLSIESVEATVVEDGLQAVEALKKEVFDLVFLDIRMPKKNGWETFGEINRLAPNMFCVFMTGYASEVEILQKIEKLGIICLKKPFEDLNQLKEIIRAVLRKSQVCLQTGGAIKERRVYPRLALVLDVDYRIKEEQRFRPGKSKNIALGGLKLLVRENLAPGTELELVMKAPAPPGAGCRATGKVVWIKKAEEGPDYYDVGVRFLEMDFSRLAEFMAHCEKAMQK